MTYKKTTLYLLTWLLVGSNLVAQTTDTDKPKWEIGTDLLWLINKNTLPKYSVLVRRKIGENNALRLRLGMDKSKTQFSYQIPLDYDSWVFQVGYEKTIPLEDVNLYFGFDCLLGAEDRFSLLPVLDTPLSIPNVVHYVTNTQTRTKGISGFFGIKYFLYKNLSISTETHLSIVQEYIKVPGYNSEGNRISKSIAPIQVLNLSIHF